jgi:crotonobetainyl-CoA:carnitine CoA-transferase CaiB-like acyl-CoA transferase
MPATTPATTPPPTLGEHTDQVLASLGYTADEIAGHRKQGIV